ncbi:hypothetical protein B0T20DRAFT_500043 [Sordaria brevicollis]|uniref:Uncharacterized protein n=1 Tax=Sordaria brevicollis TaxID=83679 RepID=A0AAE0PB57_SORBR|nr:hypothetical protein B0T20DRAFT_500043 [Sordaria brevicollis]
MKYRLVLTLSAASAFTTQVLAAPHVERPGSYRDLNGTETITTKANAEHHVDSLPGLPRLATISTSAAAAYSTEAVEDVPIPIVTPGWPGSRLAPPGPPAAISTSAAAQSSEAVEDVPIPIVTAGWPGSRLAPPGPPAAISTSAQDAAQSTVEDVPIPIVTAGWPGSRLAPPGPVNNGMTTMTVTATPPIDPDTPEPTSTSAPYGENMMKQQYTTLTFTYNTMTTTYTLALPNGAEISETPAPVIRSSRSFPLAAPSGTWTELNTMVTSTVPAADFHIRRRDAIGVGIGALETVTSMPLPVISTSTSIPDGDDGYDHYYRVNPLPAPNPNPLADQILEVYSTPAPTTLTMLPKPKMEVQTTILNGGKGAVQREYTPEGAKNEGVYAGKKNDALVNPSNDANNHKDDRPSSHDMSWYMTASYTDDSVSLTMNPCALDWQCWPEPTSTSTEVFLPGVDGGKLGTHKNSLPVETELATVRA